MESKKELHKRLEEMLKKSEEELIQSRIDLEKAKKETLEYEERFKYMPIKNFGFDINKADDYNQKITDLIEKKSMMDLDEYLEKLESLRTEILISLRYDLGYQRKNEIENSLIKSAYQIINSGL